MAVVIGILVCQTYFVPSPNDLVRLDITPHATCHEIQIILQQQPSMFLPFHILEHCIGHKIVLDKVKHKVGMTTFRLKTQRHGTFLSLPLVVVWIVGTFHALCTTHKQHLAIRVEKSHKSLTHRELSNGERG